MFIFPRSFPLLSCCLLCAIASMRWFRFSAYFQTQKRNAFNLASAWVRPYRPDSGFASFQLAPRILALATAPLSDFDTSAPDFRLYRHWSHQTSSWVIHTGIALIGAISSRAVPGRGEPSNPIPASHKRLIGLLLFIESFPTVAASSRQPPQESHAHSSICPLHQ